MQVRAVVFLITFQVLWLLRAEGQNGFKYRGYLGWMVDFSRSSVDDKWPSIRLDSGIYSDYLETLDFLQRSGMNEITPWGLFTNENWEPEVEKTISSERKALVRKVIQAAHDRHIKVVCGLGVYSWGFGKILRENPGLACPVNKNVMDLSNPESWQWQRMVLDYIMDNFDFDGISMQSGDKGWCQSGAFANTSAMQYHAILNQKAVQYIRSKKPAYIIGICGWGMDMGSPADFAAICDMTKGVDYLIDVGETASFTGTAYRKKLIKALSPCTYGNTAIPNIEPIQALRRDMYFIPTVFSAGRRLKEIYSEGGRACEAYARTRGNPGDKVTAEVLAGLLSDPRQDIRTELELIIKAIYAPSNVETLHRMADLFEQSEKAFFSASPATGGAGQYDNVILLTPREQHTASVEYFKKMDKASTMKYAHTLHGLLDEAMYLKNFMGNRAEMELLINSISNTIKEVEVQ